MNNSSLLLSIAFLFLLYPSVSDSIELSLEENRAQRGNIGYIDMQRLFKTFPDTLRAKENFEEVVRQAEEQVNLRKAEILRLRHELSRLKIEREFMAKTPMIIEKPPPKPANPIATSSNAAITTLPGFNGASTASAQLPPPAPDPPDKLIEIDADIALKTRELAQKESGFKDYQAAAEKDLLDLESRRTEILLGRIYQAVQEVARQEGVSVVVDKGSILYGHDAVDLTEKTLKRLKGL